MKKPGFNAITISIIGFALAILLASADEIFDIPYHLFNFAPTPINWAEIGVESIFLFLVGSLTVSVLWRIHPKRKRAEEQLVNINSVLKAVRDINQLIVHERNKDNLIQKSCDLMVETRGFLCVWILLLDENRRYISAAVAGSKEVQAFSRQLVNGNYPPCVDRILQHKDSFALCDEIMESSSNCLPGGYFSGGKGLISRLECEGKVYGVASVYVPLKYATDPEEQSLFKGLAGDIAFALASIEKEGQRRRMEQSWVKSEASLAEAQRLAHIGSWELDLASNTLTWSDEVSRICGLKPAQSGATYEAFLDNIHPDDRDMVAKAYSESLKNKTPYNLVHRLLLKDGTVKYVNERCETFYGSDGKPTRSIGTIQDITERKLVEEQYRLLAEHSADIIYRLEIVTERYTYVSPSVEQLLGYSIDEALRLQPKDILTPESYQRQHEAMISAISNRRTPETLQVDVIHKYGYIVPIEVNASFILDANGKPIEIVGVARDISERNKVERQLEHAAEEWRTTFDSITDLISIHDKDFNIVRVNKAFADSLNMKPRELIGKKCYQVVHGTNQPVPNCPHMKTIETKAPVIEEFFEPHLGIHLEVATSPMLISNGEVMASVHVARDITKHKQMEERISIFSNAIATASDAMIITDIKGTITFVNPATEAMYGYRKEEILGKSVTSLNADPEMAKKIMSIMTETGSWSGEIKAIRNNKETFPALLSISAVKDEKGATIAAMASLRNITMLKGAEEALQRSAETLRHMFESLPQGITISDMERRIVDVNEVKVRMHGYDSKEELIGRSFFDFVAEKDHARAEERLKERLIHGNTRGIEYTFVTKDGREFPAEVSLAVLRDSSGNPTGYIAITEDVTERKKTQEHLIVTDRLASIGQLASGIAHELNNPLTGVIGFSELLMEKDLPSDIKEDLITINREAKRTANIVKGLLTFARKQGVEKETADIHSIIQGVLQLRSYEQRVNNIEVNTRFASNLPRVFGNGGQLQQVFVNIVVNAEQAMLEAHGRGALTISTEEAGNFVRISFSDDGPGISPENISKLFTPFFTTKEVGKGTGLGLSICHGIVTEHGGKIYAESELGKGATFVVELPIKRENIEVAAK